MPVLFSTLGHFVAYCLWWNNSSPQAVSARPDDRRWTRELCCAVYYIRQGLEGTLSRYLEPCMDRLAPFAAVRVRRWPGEDLDGRWRRAHWAGQGAC